MGEDTDDPEITSNIFAQAFKSVSDESNYSRNFSRLKREKERQSVNFYSPELLPYNEAFTYEKFHLCLSRTSESSPRPDKVTYSMIKNCHSNLKYHILEIFNRIYSQNVFPKIWKTAIIIPIRKPDKDPTNPLNYRPISLTSCLCKLLEKMINMRLMWYLEQGNHINPNQSGYRPNRSSTDSLAKFETDVSDSISRGEHTIAVFLEMHRVGIRGNLASFVKNFVSERKIQVRVGSSL